LDEYCSEYNPFETFFHVAVLSHGLNTQRKRLFTLLKSRGLTPLSYISPNAYVHASAKFGEHVFIFEDNTVQPFTSIGEGVILWSGNHIGHHSNLGNYSLITSQVVVSGNVTIGDFDYLGVNATITNNVILGRLVMVNANAIVAENVPEKSIVKSTKGTIENLNLSRIPYFDETYLNID
jgi:UDP-3-O-[3-hydroxymyristoyl] glucosamine N-acyltransferase